MSQSVLLKAAGLQTFPNNLSEIPPGSLSVADNVVIDRNGIIEPRRGFPQYGDTFGLSTDRAKQLMVYKDRLLRHFNDTIQYDNGSGTFTDFSGSYTETETGLRIKSLEANGNFYFTTNEGIKTISAASASDFSPAANYIRPAGGIQALDLNGSVDYSSGGWFTYQTDVPGQTKVAYRMTWAFKDANDNLVEGAPSSQLILVNYSTTASANVVLTFQIPSSISTTDTQFYYRIYRTGIVQTSPGFTLADINPGDDENLVIEAFPSASELSSNYYFTVTPANATAGATYTNNSETFTVVSTITGGTTLIASGTGAPDPSGTLTKTSGTGDATITFSTVSTPRSITITDNVPETFRQTGELLYTNRVSGEGILQSNYAPPIAKDVALFQNTVFYANTQTIQQLNLALISVLDLVSGTSSITITQGITTNTYTFVGTKEIQKFEFDTKANTADGGYFLINSSSNEREYFVWYMKNGETTFTFDTKANTAGGSYLLIDSPVTTNQYFAWFKTSGSDTEPVAGDTSGRIALLVDIQTAVTAADVATAFYNALPPVDFPEIADSLAGVITVYNNVDGTTTNATEGTIPLGGSFSIVIADNTPTPNDTDTLGRLEVQVDIRKVTTAVEVAAQTFSALSSISDFDPQIEFSFTVTAANATAGATYQNLADPNGTIYTVQATITGGTTLLAAGTTIAPTTGTLTKISGTGDTTITYSAVVATDTLVVYNADNGTCDPAVDGITAVGGTFAITELQAGTGEDVAAQQVLLGGSVSPAISIDETARSLVRCINANPDEVVDAFYTSTDESLPGLIMLQARTLSDPAFSVTADTTTTGAEFSPALPTSGTSVSSLNEVEPNAIYYSKFQQPEAVPIVNKFLVGPKDKAILRILPLRSGLMILKEDAIYRLTGVNGSFSIDPFDNSAIILAADSAVVLNNQIYMFSTQGVVTLTDTGVNVLSRPIEDQLTRIITPAFDYQTNTFGVAYESDRAYLMWTVTNSNDTYPTQCFRYNMFTNSWTRWPISKTCGIVKFDEQRLYLGPADANFIEQERKNANRTDYADREYDLQLPADAVVTPTEISISSVANIEVGDVLVQTQYLTLQQFNQLLQKLDLDPGVGDSDYYSTLAASAGADLRNSLDDLATKLDADSNLAPASYEFTVTPANATIGAVYTNNGETFTVLSTITGGAALSCTGTGSPSGSGTLTKVSGTGDATITFSSFALGTFTSNLGGGSTFVDFQDDFNVISGLLNANMATIFKNYLASTGTVDFDLLVIELVQNTSNVRVKYAAPVIEGPITSFRGIKSEIVWAPQAFGDPSISKHVSEGTYLFDNTVFYAATASYSSDLSPSFEEIAFDESGIGDWGGFVWNQQSWGGEGTSVPLRTYIPRNKQYCRFIKPRLVHNIAREKFSLLGTSLTFRPLTERAYRS